MSHRPAQQTEDDERDGLVLELGILTGRIHSATGKFPALLLTMTKRQNGMIDFSTLSNLDIAHVCAQLREEFPRATQGEQTAN
jgi:hypothetical protein